ncbi:MAG: hypothetical protein SO031_11090, partial [Candidatus Ventricola sp.]|nr:hypothetical protein [Candidatus Ventricola sp.]
GGGDAQQPEDGLLVAQASMLFPVSRFFHMFSPREHHTTQRIDCQSLFIEFRYVLIDARKMAESISPPSGIIHLRASPASA